ncbi:hypothetical protein GGQ74_002977 [Desulfobaculum xiamenense]|uniref:Uncharacterized protein n=1 Tax=Desulfobaculum xiamenense TaxID=995050 RepID=A0A846QQM0_9BACT|nr:hypothetical protein [Desulfobaculum xiamenense]NJB69280.1 hypothetical protein [Desulfobaculum xiamenense]
MPFLKPMCEICPLRRFAERRPQSLIARIWRWHISWCPGYRLYKRQAQGEAQAEAGRG